ncbi:Rossmann-like domain-containing protein [Streptomyces sp. NPDC085524]|uniref:Rossmann-like domain-containing protein n=1 Tax=Streptomyces sp. NPDC085524 TaxID=3365728 RepID=UPI0037D58817
MGHLLVVESWVGSMSGLLPKAIRKGAHEFTFLTRALHHYLRAAPPGGGPHPLLTARNVVTAETNDTAALLPHAEPLHEELGFAGVVSSCDDDLPAAARLAERLGLPGPAAAAVENACRKDLTRRVLAGAGVPGPRFALCADTGRALTAARGIGYPLVVKPADLCAGMLVRLVRDEYELERACRDLAAFPVNAGGQYRPRAGRHPSRTPGAHRRRPHRAGPGRRLRARPRRAARGPRLHHRPGRTPRRPRPRPPQRGAQPAPRRRGRLLRRGTRRPAPGRPRRLRRRATVADLLEHPLPPVRIAALDAHLIHARPHTPEHGARPCAIPAGSTLHRSRARARAVVGLLPEAPGCRVLVVGVVNFLLERLRERGIPYTPCDLKGGTTEWGETVRTDALAELGRCDAVLASGMTLGNRTFQPLLDHAAATGKPLVMFAQNGSAVLPRFLGSGVHAVSAEPYPFSWLDGGPGPPTPACCRSSAVPRSPGSAPTGRTATPASGRSWKASARAG